MSDYLELIIGLITLSVVVVSGVIWGIRYHLSRIRKLEKKIEILQEQKENDNLRERLQEVEQRASGLQKHIRDLQEKNENLLKRFYQAQLQVKQLESQRKDLQQKCTNAVKIIQHNCRVARQWKAIAQQQSHKLEQFIKEWAREKNQGNELIENQKQQIEELDRLRLEKETGLEQNHSKIHELEKHVEDLLQQVEEQEQRDEATIEQQGRTWETPVPEKAPPFVPRPERKTQIVSVINLKGGVGKTTLTANLGATLGQQGYKVLLVDLDYQRSLSLMCCTQDEIKMLHLEKRCLQHFLLGEQSLDRCITTVATAHNCDVVICSEAQKGRHLSDALEDTEMHLLVNWLIHPEKKDPRFLLREALHSFPLRDRYDYILLDCRPAFSTASINALMASDFALVPVLLNETSASSVPHLLRKLRRLQEAQLISPLKILGIVANRAQFYGGNLLKAMRPIWKEMEMESKVAWGSSVYFFKTMIKEDLHFGVAANERSFAAYHEKLKPIFADLTEEFMERIKHESQSLAAVPV